MDAFIRAATSKTTAIDHAHKAQDFTIHDTHGENGNGRQIFPP